MLAVMLAGGASGNMLCAQTDVDLDPDFGGRLSVGVVKKVAKGFSLSLDEELRMDNGMASVDRLMTTLGVRYDVNRYLRLGIGYSMINAYDAEASEFDALRHRLMADVTLRYKAGNWEFSLRERFQSTTRTDEFNEYQATKTSLGLKSRLKVAYKNKSRWDPYAYLELRHTLNGAEITAYYDGTRYLTEDGKAKGDPGWFLDGWTKTYLDRTRLAVGTTFSINKSNELDLYVMGDRETEYSIDANAEGTKLKSYTCEKGFVGWVGASYTFKF